MSALPSGLLEPVSDEGGAMELVCSKSNTLTHLLRGLEGSGWLNRTETGCFSGKHYKNAVQLKCLYTFCRE